MLPVHWDILILQLLFQPLPRHTIAHEEILRIFIIDKIAHGILIRVLSALLHSRAVIIRVLNYFHAPAPEQILLPLLGVSGHVDNHVKAQPGAHDADAHSQVSRASHLDRILSKEIAEFLACQDAVVIGLFELS